MIKHIVMLGLRNDYNAVELQAIMQGLATLELAGFEDFAHGPNHDFESKTQRYPYGFIATFKDAKAVTRYAKDPGHQALGARLVALCDGGYDGIMVMDIETS